MNPDADDRVTMVPSFDFETDMSLRIELEGMTPADAFEAAREARKAFGRGVDSEDL
jgi:serine protease inhibitor